MSTTNFFPSAAGGWDRLHGGPLSSHVDDFADWLADQGYARSTGRQKLRMVGKFSRWMGEQGLDLAALDGLQLERFRTSQSRLGKPTANVTFDGRELLTWLRETDRVVPSEAEPFHHDPIAETVDRYRRFLVGERGARLNTVQAYLSTVRAFLGDCFDAKPADLGSLGLHDVNGFILHSCQAHSPATTRLHAAALRSFTGYLYQSGIMATDIADGIAGVRTWRLSSLPKGLEPDQVEAVLASCDRTTVTGRRDYGVLLLLALLGLRACEVVRLTLDDIDWCNAEMTVTGKGGRHDVLPLPHEVGEALAAYLQGGRPTCATRRLFVGRYAPVRGFQSSCAVVNIVRYALARAGIERPGRGAAHLLRHSLATKMLRNGASLEEIGQILRHQSPDSTRIYAKVDLDALRPLAPAWPGGAS